MSMLTPCELYFGLMKSSTDLAYFMNKSHVSLYCFFIHNTKQGCVCSKAVGLLLLIRC